MPFNDFTEMPVWQLAMEIAEDVFHLTEQLPRKEDYGLTSQLRNAALSISSNIAEGFGRRGSADKRRFYDFARSSGHETRNQIIYGQRVKYFTESECNPINTKIARVIHDLNKISRSLK